MVAKAPVEICLREQGKEDTEVVLAYLKLLRRDRTEREPNEGLNRRNSVESSNGVLVVVSVEDRISVARGRQIERSIIEWVCEE